MALLDAILLIWFIPAIVIGIAKGFIRQVASLAALVVGIWLACRFYVKLGTTFAGWFGNAQPAVLNAFAFITIFLAAALALSLLGKLLTKLFGAASLGWFNRLLGAVFAVIQTGVVITLAVYLFGALNAKLGIVSDATLNGSQVYCFFSDLADKVFASIISNI